MNKGELVNQWAAAVDNQTFLVPKHDPTGLAIAWERFRTVLTPEAANNLSGFIKSGEYGVRIFEDSKFPNTSGLYEIIPSGAAPYSVAGSGVASGSITPSGSYDRLVVAYAKKDGWHAYAEDSARITIGIASGRLNLTAEL